MATKIAPHIEKPKTFKLRPDETPLHDNLNGLQGGVSDLRPRLNNGREILTEPKRQNRFILTFPDQLNIPAWGCYWG